MSEEIKNEEEKVVETPVETTPATAVDAPAAEPEQPAAEPAQPAVSETQPQIIVQKERGISPHSQTAPIICIGQMIRRR